MLGSLIGGLTLAAIILGAGVFIFLLYQKNLRESKNFERGLKMVPMVIHLPPSSEDIDVGSRDQRDLTEEVLSQAQVMYNVIASTAMKGFKSKIYGQRHISFEIIAKGGLVYYYAVVPIVLVDAVRQAIAAAYPSARLEEVEEHNLFSEVGKMSGTIDGEFTLKKDAYLPIAMYTDTKRDASRALLNALSSASREDGVGIQILLRPARDSWVKKSILAADKITKEKGKKTGIEAFLAPKDVMEALWKPPESAEKEEKPEDKQLTSLEKARVEAIE